MEVEGFLDNLGKMGDKPLTLPKDEDKKRIALMKRRLLFICTLIGLSFWTLYPQRAEAQLDLWEYYSEEVDTPDASAGTAAPDEFGVEADGIGDGGVEGAVPEGGPAELNPDETGGAAGSTAEGTGETAVPPGEEGGLKGAAGKGGEGGGERAALSSTVSVLSERGKALDGEFYDFLFQGILAAGALFAIALLFLLLHFILPLRPLLFIPKLGSFFIFLGFLASLASLIYSHLHIEFPNLTREQALLWFVVSSVISLVFSRRSFPKSFLPCLFAVIPIIGSFIWILGSKYTPSFLFFQSSELLAYSSLFLYISLGFLSTATGWLISSGIVKLLGYNSKVYGVEREHWPEYRTVSHKLTVFSYLLLSISLFGFSLYSLFYSNSLGFIFGNGSKQLLTVPFLWLSLSAYQLSLRLPPPPPSIYEEEEPEELRLPRVRILPGILLLFSSLLGFALFTELYRYFL